MPRTVALLLVLVLGVVPCSTDLRAQPEHRPAEVALATGVQVLLDGNAARAVTLLRRAFELDPSTKAPDGGTAAYWLGEALLQSQQLEAALDTWEAGLRILEEGGHFDPHVADAFIRAVFEHRATAYYERAAEAYLQMLLWLDAEWPPSERAVADAYLASQAMIMPASWRRRVGLDRFEPGRRLSEGAGARLVSWWHSRDVLPATHRNERLEEHLERVALASMRYRVDGRFDDRAAVYIRLGPPSKKTEVRFNSTRFMEHVLFGSLTLSPSDFPRSEFWVYDHIDDAAQFLFVEAHQGYYRLGQANDLLPTVLRNGIGTSERGRKKAEALVRTMEEVYRQLSLLHEDFAVRYAQVAEYVEWLDQQDFEVRAELMQQRLDRQAQRSGRGDPRDGSASDDQSDAPRLLGASSDVLRQWPPDAFAQSMIMQGDLEDDLAGRRRHERIPVAHSGVLEDHEPLPVAVRWARFLEEDGRTRTEVYWTMRLEDLAPSRSGRRVLKSEGLQPPVPYLLSVAAVQHSPDYRTRTMHRRRHLVQDTAVPAGAGLLAPQTYVLYTNDDLYHVAMQWDQYAAVLDQETGRLASAGPHLKRSVARIDSLTALHAEKHILEMSDLVPLLVADDRAEQDVLSLSDAPPYPFGALGAEDRLVLYFEVYHLTYGADDKTHYVVEYEIARDEGEQDAGRRREDHTVVSTPYEHTERTARELVWLDLEDWRGRGDLKVTIRVTDTTTGRRVERSISFTLVPE